MWRERLADALGELSLQLAQPLKLVAINVNEDEAITGIVFTRDHGVALTVRFECMRLPTGCVHRDTPPPICVLRLHNELFLSSARLA